MDPSKPEPVERLSEAWWASRSPAIRARRCTGHRRNGDQCAKVAMEAQRVCGTHGGRAPQSKAKARRIIEEAADRMARELLGIAEGAESEAVKLAAVKHVLAVAGINEKHAVDVSVGPKPWEQLLGGLAPMTRAESRAARGIPDDPPPRALERAEDDRPEIVEAEVVYDRPVGRPPWAVDTPADTGRGNGPSEPPQPGTGLMTLVEANAEIARRNRANSMHGTRISDIGR